MSTLFNSLWDQAMPPAMQPRTRKRAREMVTGLLNCGGKRTITGMLAGGGRQFCDWTAAYRLFSEQRFDPQRLLDVSLQQALVLSGDNKPVIAHLDDTLLTKTGRHIPGAKWRRDPLGPPFHTNFIWGQRFLQLSLACPETDGRCRARAIPVTLRHAPSPVKPRKTASEDQWSSYHSAVKQSKLTRVGSECLQQLRQRLDQNGAGQRALLVSVDGGYTNSEVFKHLPERTRIVGRIRKDAKLYYPANAHPSTGRRRIYGEQLPTPELIRQDPDIGWKSVQGFAAGTEHTFEVKVVGPLKWRPAGGGQTLQLIIVRPLGYRLSKSSKILYRQPSYLICNDLSQSIETILQAYLWRWEIEVNFREQKTLMGCGQAQVRNQHSVESVPQFVTGVYSLLMVAAERLHRQGILNTLPRSKWYTAVTGERWTTGDICNRFRAEEYAAFIGWSFSGFVTQQHRKQTYKKQANPVISALINMRY